MQTRAKQHILQLQALTLALIFTWTTLVGPGNLSAQTIHVEQSGKGEGIPVRSLFPEIPLELGTVEEYYEPRSLPVRQAGANRELRDFAARGMRHAEPFIIHLQDAHANPPIQEKIQGILEYLNSGSSDSLLVAVEGSAGPLHPGYLNFFSDKPDVNEAIIHDLASKGELSGVEQFAWSATERGRKTNIQFEGAEEPGLYRKNLFAYRELLSKQQEVGLLLLELQKPIDLAKSHVFSPALRNFIHERERRKEGNYGSGIHSPGLAGYLSFLRSEVKEKLGIDLENSFEQIRFPQLVRIFLVQRSENKIHLQKSEEEGKKLIGVLRDKARTDEEKMLVEALSRFFEVPYPRHLAEELWRFAERYQVSLEDYPEYLKTMGQAILRSEIDPIKVFEEVDLLEKWLIEKLAQRDEERLLLEILRDFTLLKDLLNLSLTRKEYGRIVEAPEKIDPKNILERLKLLHKATPSPLSSPLQKGRGKLKNVPSLRLRGEGQGEGLENLISSALNFYGGACRRDRVILENALKKARQSRKSRLVLVTGGFHTPGLTELMKERGIGYAVIRPRAGDVNSGNLYAKVLRDEHAFVFNKKTGFTKQEALFLKAILETAVPMLWKKYRLSPSEIASRIAEIVREHPVLRERIRASAQGSHVRFLVFHLSPRLEDPARKLSVPGEAVSETGLLNAADVYFQMRPPETALQPGIFEIEIRLAGEELVFQRVNPELEFNGYEYKLINGIAPPRAEPALLPRAKASTEPEGRSRAEVRMKPGTPAPLNPKDVPELVPELQITDAALKPLVRAFENMPTILLPNKQFAYDLRQVRNEAAKLNSNFSFLSGVPDSILQNATIEHRNRLTSEILWEVFIRSGRVVESTPAAVPSGYSLLVAEIDRDSVRQQNSVLNRTAPLRVVIRNTVAPDKPGITGSNTGRFAFLDPKRARARAQADYRNRFLKNFDANKARPPKQKSPFLSTLEKALAAGGIVKDDPKGLYGDYFGERYWWMEEFQHASDFSEAQSQHPGTDLRFEPRRLNLMAEAIVRKQSPLYQFFRQRMTTLPTLEEQELKVSIPFLEFSGQLGGLRRRMEALISEADAHSDPSEKERLYALAYAAFYHYWVIQRFYQLQPQGQVTQPSHQLASFIASDTLGYVLRMPTRTPNFEAVVVNTMEQGTRSYEDKAKRAWKLIDQIDQEVFVNTVTRRGRSEVRIKALENHEIPVISHAGEGFGDPYLRSQTEWMRFQKRAEVRSGRWTDHSSILAKTEVRTVYTKETVSRVLDLNKTFDQIRLGPPPRQSELRLALQAVRTQDDIGIDSFLRKIFAPIETPAAEVRLRQALSEVDNPEVFRPDEWRVAIVVAQKISDGIYEKPLIAIIVILQAEVYREGGWKSEEKDLLGNSYPVVEPGAFPSEVIVRMGTLPEVTKAGNVVLKYLSEARGRFRLNIEIENSNPVEARHAELKFLEEARRLGLTVRDEDLNFYPVQGRGLHAYSRRIIASRTHPVGLISPDSAHLAQYAPWLLRVQVPREMDLDSLATTILMVAERLEALPNELQEVYTPEELAVGMGQDLAVLIGRLMQVGEYIATQA